MLSEETVETIDLINALFDQIKIDHQLKSDSALARFIQVPDMYIYRWRKGEYATSLRVLTPFLVRYGSTISQAKIAA